MTIYNLARAFKPLHPPKQESNLSTKFAPSIFAIIRQLSPAQKMWVILKVVVQRFAKIMGSSSLRSMRTFSWRVYMDTILSSKPFSSGCAISAVKVLTATTG